MKTNFYLTIFNQIKEGKNPNQISKQLSISKQKIYYYTNKLQEKGYILKKGYGTWEVKKQTLNPLDFTTNKSIRGHAFIWTVNIPQEIKNLSWKERLNKTKIKYKLIGKEKFPRLFIKNKKVWLGKNNIVVYENKSFYGAKSTLSRKYAVESLLCCLHALESKFNINLKPYQFKTSREHYGMIKNDLAIQCNKNNEKIIVHDDLEGDWLWVDDSESLGELETGGKKAIVRSKQVQDWWNDNKQHNFKVTPTFLMESLTNLTQMQIESNRQLLLYKEQNKSHLKLIQEYRKEIKGIKETKHKLMEEKTQRKLSEYS